MKNCKMKLPKDYKEFLLDTNGGQFIDEIHMFWVDELKENIGIDVLFGFNQVRSLCLNSWYNEYGEELSRRNNYYWKFNKCWIDSFDMAR